MCIEVGLGLLCFFCARVCVWVLMCIFNGYVWCVCVIAKVRVDDLDNACVVFNVVRLERVRGECICTWTWVDRCAFRAFVCCRVNTFLVLNFTLMFRGVFECFGMLF